MTRALFLMVALISFALAPSAADVKARADVQDLHGRPVDLVSGGDKAVVLLFLSVECPISNSYAPEIQRLHERFSPKGIRFALIYPNASESADEIRKHVRDYRLTAEAFRDPEQALVKAAKVRVTPEAAVFVRGAGWLYRGRIDDRYVELGKARPEPTQHDLRDLLQKIVENQPVQPHATSAVGCSISR